MDLNSILELCEKCKHLRHNNKDLSYGVTCVMFFDPPKKYIDEKKCPRYECGEDVKYIKGRKVNGSKI